MRLTLDWDSDALKEMHLDAVLEQQPVEEQQRRLADFSDVEPEAQKWELWQSSNHGNGGSDGWHYVEYDLDGGLEDMRRLRRAYGDDALRVSLDGKRIEWGSPFPSILYHMKNIKPYEQKPYETDNRAQLVERHGFDESEYVETKAPDGSLNYGNIIESLADHPDFGSRAALFRQVQGRGSVDVTTEPSKRAYDLVNDRRTPTRAEAKALRDYAEAREIGHYGEQAEGTPEELAEKPTRTAFHEYWEMPEFEMDQGNFDPDDKQDTDSEWYPVNFRTGTYGDGEHADEMTVKQIHDKVVDHFREELSPSAEVDHPDGTTTHHGFEEPVERYDYQISLERERPLDQDEYGQYKAIWARNQPQRPKETLMDRVERSDVQPWGPNAVHWEMIVYEGENALEQGGGANYWWIARGVLDASDPDAVRNPIRNSLIAADTRGWL